MDHSVVLVNDERILRPVTVDDAEFIVYLRNLPHVKGNINDTSTDVEKQREWIRKYLERPNEWYWIVESLDHRPLGTTSLYHYNAEKRQIESGRWAMVSNHNLSMVHGRTQLYDWAFSNIDVDHIVCDVASHNKHVLRYHRLLGEREIGVEKGLFVIDGHPVDMIWFDQSREGWPEAKKRIMRIFG